MFYIVGLGTGLVSFFIGCIWYAVLFGKVWQKLMGFSDEKVKSIFVPQRIIVALLSDLIASLCTVGILFNLPFPLIVRAVMLIVVVIGSGIKLAIFDGKSFGLILINEGYKVISILLFFVSLTLFGGAIVF
jgi:hypothetical protein